MSLFKIAWRSIQQRALSSWLTGFSMALGVALVVAVLVVLNTVENTFRRNAGGFDLIVGAKGGKLQLVLNTVYHLSTPIENVPYDYYLEFKKKGQDGAVKDGRYSGAVDVAVPFCLGDNYQGYRCVGTTTKLFDLDYPDGRGMTKYAFAEGRNFDPDHFFEAVIGSMVAQKTGLKVGDEFNPTHGLTEGAGHEHDAFTVVGILEPTGTPNDRALFVNIEGFYLLDGHALDPSFRDAGIQQRRQDAKPPKIQNVSFIAQAEGEDEGESHEDGHDHAHPEPLPIEKREVTAILIRSAAADPMASMNLFKHINKNRTAQAVQPTREIFNLFDGIVGNLQTLLVFLAGLIVVVAGIGIMVSIYNSMSERQHDIAVMRALGASRKTVMLVILYESAMLSLAGGIGGMVLGHLGVWALNPWIEQETGLTIGLFDLAWLTLNLNDFALTAAAVQRGWLSSPILKLPWELLLIPALIVLATIAGYVPAMSAYRTDVGKALSATP